MLRSGLNSFLNKIICLVLIAAVGLSPTVSYAQSVFVSALPEPGTMLAASPAFTPVMVKGMVVHPDQPLNFDFIVDSGNDSADPAFIKEQTARMAKYFLAAVTVPEDQLWVNLSPYEKDRIIENELGSTVLGRDMLAQDYVLKQLTASLIYPEQGLGKEFWARIYQQALARFGTTDIPVDTFNKVWITPATAEIFEKNNAVYVTKARLKVQLDTDLLAQQTTGENVDVGARFIAPGDTRPANTDKSALAQQLLREIIIPALETEVNEGKNFATIRQVYNAAILAKWYRDLIQDTLLARSYMGQNRVAGVTSDEKMLKEEIYARYIAAYKKGVFNYIKEEPNTATGETIPKKYFSGGIQGLTSITLKRNDNAMAALPLGQQFDVSLALQTFHESLPVLSLPAGPLSSLVMLSEGRADTESENLRTDPAMLEMLIASGFLNPEPWGALLLGSLTLKAFLSYRSKWSRDLKLWYYRNEFITKFLLSRAYSAEVLLAREREVRGRYKKFNRIRNESYFDENIRGDQYYLEYLNTLFTPEEIKRIISFWRSPWMTFSQALNNRLQHYDLAIQEKAAAQLFALGFVPEKKTTTETIYYLLTGQEEKIYKGRVLWSEILPEDRLGRKGDGLKFAWEGYDYWNDDLENWIKAQPLKLQREYLYRLVVVGAKDRSIRSGYGDQDWDRFWHEGVRSIDPIRDNVGAKKAGAMLEATGWQPETMRERINLYEATDQWDKLAALNDLSVVSVLTRNRRWGEIAQLAREFPGIPRYRDALFVNFRIQELVSLGPVVLPGLLEYLNFDDNAFEPEIATREGDIYHQDIFLGKDPTYLPDRGLMVKSFIRSGIAKMGLEALPTILDLWYREQWTMEKIVNKRIRGDIERPYSVVSILDEMGWLPEDVNERLVFYYVAGRQYDFVMMNPPGILNFFLPLKHWGTLLHPNYFRFMNREIIDSFFRDIYPTLDIDDKEIVHFRMRGVEWWEPSDLKEKVFHFAYFSDPRLKTLDFPGLKDIALEILSENGKQWNNDFEYQYYPKPQMLRNLQDLLFQRGWGGKEYLYSLQSDHLTWREPGSKEGLATLWTVFDEDYKINLKDRYDFPAVEAEKSRLAHARSDAFMASYRLTLGAKADSAAVKDSAQTQDVGGITINNIDVNRAAGSGKIHMNDAVLESVLKAGFSGFAPVVISVTPIASPLPLLGVALPTAPRASMASAVPPVDGKELDHG
jgi:hypothetical protein